MAYVILNLVCVAALVGIDQAIKLWAAQYLAPVEAITVIPHVVELRFVLNQGMAFSLLSGKQLFLILATSAALLLVAYLLFFRSRGKLLQQIAFILVLASLKHGLTPVYIALAGTAVSAVFLAVTQVLVVFFDVAQELSYWTAGGISGIRMTAILGVVPWTILGLILAVSVSRSVTLLSFGEDMAIGLGGRLSRIRLRAGLAVLILAGSAVAVAGPVGFVGLVVPHITRRIVGIDYRLVVPFSALLGALLVLVADMVARTVAPPFEIPLGAVTALVGVPFFLYLANRKEVRG